jgi:hypothetical protein
MKKILPIFLISFILVPVRSQENKQLIVSNIRHSVINNGYYNVNITSFPCYFNDTLFQSDILDTIMKYASQKFSADTILLAEKEFSTCIERPYPIKIKPIVPANAVISNLYMSISSSISFRRVEFEDIFYQLTTDIQLVDGKNKKILKAKTVLPFVIKESEGIISDTLMHIDDFEIFYLDALSSCLKGKSETLGKRFIYQPLSEQYDDFLYQSSEYIVLRADTNFVFQKPEGESLKILTINPIELPGKELDSLYLTYTFLRSYKVSHVNGRNEYRADFRSKTYSSEDQQKSFEVEMNVSGGIDSGNLLFDPSGNLIGTWNADSVQIIWRETGSVAEVKINKHLVALIRFMNDGEHLYYRHDLYPNKLSECANLVFLYGEANDIMQTTYQEDPDNYSLELELLNLLLSY